MKTIKWTKDGCYFSHSQRNLDCPVCDSDELREVHIRERVSKSSIKIESIGLECMNDHKYQVGINDE